jgi:hypothetical protein
LTLLILKKGATPMIRIAEIFLQISALISLEPLVALAV